MDRKGGRQQQSLPAQCHAGQHEQPSAQRDSSMSPRTVSARVDWTYHTKPRRVSDGVDRTTTGQILYWTSSSRRNLDVARSASNSQPRTPSPSPLCWTSEIDVARSIPADLGSLCRTSSNRQLDVARDRDRHSHSQPWTPSPLPLCWTS